MKLLNKNLLNYMQWILLDKNDFEKLTNEHDVTFHSSKNEKYMLPIIQKDLKRQINYKNNYYFLEPQQDGYLAYWGNFSSKNLEGIEMFYSDTQFIITID